MNKARSLFALVLMSIAPMALSAQPMFGDQDISLSYGRTSGTEILHWFKSKPPSRDYGQYNVKQATTGNMFATYRYTLASHFSLGATLGTESFSYTKYHNGSVVYFPPYPGPYQQSVIANYHVNVTTLAVEAREIYFSHKRLKLYGMQGIGVRFYTQKSTPAQAFDGIGSPVFINTQMTPIGIAYGNKLTGFAEVGLGYKGLINGGISYRFARKHQVKSTENK